MCQYNKKILKLFFLAVGLLSIKSSLHGQDCSLMLSGYVVAEESQEPLIGATLQWQPSGQVAITNVDGYFELSNGCGAKGELVVSYVGYATQRYALYWQRDSSLHLALKQEVLQIIEPVEIVAVAAPSQAVQMAAMDRKNITARTGQTLAGMLENLSGVSQLQNGTHISKPVVHGLYGNRLTILNNGVPQNGQQWGNDHGPAIDPLVADRLMVVKGAGSVQYPSSNMGNVVLVEPARIGDASDWRARGTYTLNTNGWGHALNLAAQYAHRGWAWRLNGTFQKSGDQATPNYWLRNTGQQLGSAALQLEREWSPKLRSDLYISTYNAELGVLRGAHVGNLTDLESAFQRCTPFFTRSYFSYELEAPRQEVHHHLAKLVVYHEIGGTQHLRYTVAVQLNNRQEYDVRRGGRTNRPALSLLQDSYFAEVIYERSLCRRTTLKTGIQGTLINNTNQPGTGILPLIPDFRSFRTGAFGIIAYHWKRSRWELGLRYDYLWQSVAAISGTRPRRILRYNNQWGTGNITLGWSHRFTKDWKLVTNASYAARPPAINERYSQGLHQGVSGIEEGNPNLEAERVGQVNVGFVLDLQSWLALDVMGYGQWFDNYIYLQPLSEARLTIRGAFPVFEYQQTQARLMGTDATIRLKDGKHWQYSATYGFLRGDDLATGLPVVNLPPNTLCQRLEYHVSPDWSWGGSRLTQLRLGLSYRYTWQQYHLTTEQDFLAPPLGYHLLGASFLLEGETSRTHWRLWGRIDNALNTTYRDYLNRQRYFADAVGRSVTLGINVILIPAQTENITRQ